MEGARQDYLPRVLPYEILTASSYQSMILPIYNDELRVEVRQRKPTLKSPVDLLSPEVISALVRLFEKQSQLEVVLADVRRKLRVEQCMPYRLFEAIDSDNSLYIDAENLVRFVESRGGNLTVRGVDSVVRRFDKDGDGKLSFVEFLPAILPFRPGDVATAYSTVQSASVVLAERKRVLSAVEEEAKSVEQAPLESAEEEYRTPAKKPPMELPAASPQHTTATAPSSIGKARRFVDRTIFVWINYLSRAAGAAQVALQGSPAGRKGRAESATGTGQACRAPEAGPVAARGLRPWPGP